MAHNGHHHSKPKNPNKPHEHKPKKSKGDAQFEAMISVSSSSMIIYELISDISGTKDSEIIADLKVVQDDSKQFLIDGNMTESLKKVISEINQIAIEEGNEELIDNPERIALEILAV